MFARLARFVSRHWVLVLLVWVAVPLAVNRLAPSWDDVTHDGDFAYLPDRMSSVRGETLLQRGFPNVTAKSQVVLVISRRDGRLQPGDFAVTQQLTQIFTPKEGEASPVSAVWSPEDPVVGRKLISPVRPSGQAALVVLHLDTEFTALGNMTFVAQVYRTLDELRAEEGFPAGLELGVSGSAAIGCDTLFAAEESIRNTELATIALVVVILLVVYRAPGLVAVPLLAIAVSMVLSYDLIALLAQFSDRTRWFDFQVFKTTKIFIVVVLFGAATDYCLFLIARYREELERGLSPSEAIEQALGQVGHALAASAMTTILGLGAMIFADFGKFRYGGPTIALSLVIALLACLTAAPALLRAGGRWVFWPFGVGASGIPVKAGNALIGPRSRPRGFRRFWELLAGTIVARPGLVLVGSLLLLALPAYAGLSVPITYDLVGELNPDRPAVRGTRLLQEYFPVGEAGPITVLAYDPAGSFDNEEGRRKISLLTKELGELPYTDGQGTETTPIQGVRSLTNPLGDPPGSFSPFTPAGRRKMAALKNPRTKATFLSDAPGYTGNVTRFDLIGQYDPFSRESVQLLNHVERHLLALSADSSSPWHGTAFDFVGITASIRDLEAVNTSDCLRVGALVSIAVLAVLVFVLRRTLISVYLVFTVLLGYFVTLGITKTFFAWAHGDTFHGLDWKLPLFLFVILVAVGEDYNIYLATRVFEEQRRRGLLEGLRVAVIQTGGIITSCGVIMAGTFASMLTGTLRGMHQLGFALSLGVILDTFIIRTIIVPAFLALWARWLPGETATPTGNDGRTTSSAKEPATGGHPLAAPHWQGGHKKAQPRKAKGAKSKRPAA